MGSASSIVTFDNFDILNSKSLHEIKTYLISRETLLKQFFKDIKNKKAPGESDLISLQDILAYLTMSDNDEISSVSLYASPFLGQFSNSKYCYKEAYKSSIIANSNQYNFVS